MNHDAFNQYEDYDSEVLNAFCDSLFIGNKIRYLRRDLNVFNCFLFRRSSVSNSLKFVCIVGLHHRLQINLIDATGSTAIHLKKINENPFRMPCKR